MRHLDSLLDDLLALRPHDRPTFFQMRGEQEREAIMAMWAESPRLRATDICALPQPYQAELVSFVVGDPQRGRPGVGGVFRVEPTGKPVNLERGSMGNRRKFDTITKATFLPADRAIHALLCYGPDAANEAARGRLREVSEEQVEQLAPVAPIAADPMAATQSTPPRETAKAKAARELYEELGDLEAVSQQLYPKSKQHPSPVIRRWAAEFDWPLA